MVSRQRQWMLLLGLSAALLQLSSFAECSKYIISRKNIAQDKVIGPPKSSNPVKLRHDRNQVVLDNGILSVSFSVPEGFVTGVQYKGINNLLGIQNEPKSRGYWDVTWNKPGNTDTYEKISGTNFKVILEDENQVEVSFTRTWNASHDGSLVPLNIDQRYVMRKGSSGFYSYAIFERPKGGGPDMDVDELRVVFKLNKDMFHYMVVSDDRQRIMPSPDDRLQSYSKTLDYKEAVQLTAPKNPSLKGEVDDKYMYSCDNKDNKVHGWISTGNGVGFWLISPSNEFRNAGPVKQDLTSHVGPTTISYFVSRHYAGEDVAMHFRNGELWKKVFGPVFIYINSASTTKDPRQTLWENAKAQMSVETNSWPYDFIHSEDFAPPSQRGTVSGQLAVHDGSLIMGDSAYVGLAVPGEAGSWQRESKDYQFWTQADRHGQFTIKSIRVGIYNLYAWVPGVIGDYKFNASITIKPGDKLNLGRLIYRPPRHGPTLWEIGVPDRTAAEFFIPDPIPTLMNHLYIKSKEKFRQYGLWERYGELYPHHDLVYNVGRSNYKLEWFFAHVPRNIGNNTYQPTTWQIVFELKQLIKGTYKLRVALASAQNARIQIRFNDANAKSPHFTTETIGRDNAIARHGIHGLYWLFDINVPSSLLHEGKNIIFLAQTKNQSPFDGVMYDYIRLEVPPSM